MCLVQAFLAEVKNGGVGWFWACVYFALYVKHWNPQTASFEYAEVAPGCARTYLDVQTAKNLFGLSQMGYLG